MTIVERLGHDDLPAGLEGEAGGQPVVEGIRLPQVVRAERREEPCVGLALLPVPDPGLRPERRDVGSQVHPDGEEVRGDPHDGPGPRPAPRQLGRASEDEREQGDQGQEVARDADVPAVPDHAEGHGEPRQEEGLAGGRGIPPEASQARHDPGQEEQDGAAHDHRDRPRERARQMGGLIHAGSDPEDDRQEIDGQDPRGLESRQTPLEARAGHHRRPVVGEVVDPERQAPEDERADAEPRRSPERQAGVHQEQGQQGGDERVHDLEIEVEAEPPGETHRDRDPASGRLGERPGEPEGGAEEHDLADEEMLDVVRPGERVVRRDVCRHHGGEEKAQEPGPAAEEDAAGAVDGQTERERAERRNQIEGPARDPEEEEERSRGVRLRDARVVLHPEEDGELPPEHVGAHEAGDRLIGIEPGVGQVERQEEPEQREERPEPPVARAAGRGSARRRAARGHRAAVAAPELTGRPAAWGLTALPSPRGS